MELLQKQKTSRPLLYCGMIGAGVARIDARASTSDASDLAEANALSMSAKANIAPSVNPTKWAVRRSSIARHGSGL
jgi:hypothetical protein